MKVSKLEYSHSLNNILEGGNFVIDAGLFIYEMNNFDQGGLP